MSNGRIIRAGLLGALLAGVVLAATAGTPAVAAPPPETLPPMERLDLNSATLEQLRELPISDDMARAILDHREYIGFFESIYDLAEIDGMTPTILQTLRGLISTVEPPVRDEALVRYDESFRQVERFLSDEGASEELADELLDQLRDPRNINDLSLYELMSFQNVSPVDAVAILQGRKRLGKIEGDRQLRNLDGLAYWGYRNLRDFVVYEDEEEKNELHGDLQFITFNTPYSAGGDENDTVAGVLLADVRAATAFFDSPNPAVLTKLRLRVGSQYKAGAMTYRDVGENALGETGKGYFTWQPQWKSDYRLDKLVVGNYRVAFGQGLVMNNTDFYLPRQTGYGWNKRPQTVFGDLGRSSTFALQGGAVEFTLGRVHGIGFASTGKKDGIVNLDPEGNIESYNRYLVMSPRFEQDVLDVSNAGLQTVIRREVIEEDLFGANLKLELWPGTYVGVSGYEAQYDKPFDPKVTSIVARSDLLQARDSELFEDYSSLNLGNFRRVVGTEFQAVYENVAVQGEYAKLDSNPDGNLFSQAPQAWTVNGYVQYGDLNFLALYRDYDVGFDNPYARAFSNDSRYEQTLLGDYFRLNNGLMSYLAISTPQMKPERGLFLSTRYRVSRSFTITGLDYDQWTRVADGQDMRRYTLRMEYQPIWPLRFRVRHRFSSRGEQIVEDVRRFRSWDSRIETVVRLSGFDEFRILYSTGNTEFAPRPRLSETPENPSADSALPQGASPGQALQIQLRHNVNPNLMVILTSLMYDGFLWNFEDNEFVLLEGNGFRNWAVVRSRVSDNLLLRFKFTTDRLRTGSSVLSNRDIARNGSQLGDEVRLQDTSFRLQLDYTF